MQMTLFPDGRAIIKGTDRYWRGAQPLRAIRGKLSACVTVVESTRERCRPKSNSMAKRLITGGSGGIGRATALLFAREGAAVVIVDLNQEAGNKVASEITGTGGRAIFERADVTCSADCQHAVERATREFGGVHILFNNAGIIRRASVIETSEEDWDAVMAVNVKSIFFMCREVIPVMTKAGGGSIISTASGWGLAAGSRAAAYCRFERRGRAANQSNGHRPRQTKHSCKLHLSRRHRHRYAAQRGAAGK